MVDLCQEAKAMNVYPAFNRRQVLDFAVATMGSPVVSTLIKAVGPGELFRAVKCALQPKVEHVVIITGESDLT